MRAPLDFEPRGQRDAEDLRSHDRAERAWTLLINCVDSHWKLHDGELPVAQTCFGFQRQLTAAQSRPTRCVRGFGVTRTA